MDIVLTESALNQAKIKDNTQISRTCIDYSLFVLRPSLLPLVGIEYGAAVIKCSYKEVENKCVYDLVYGEYVMQLGW